MSLRRRRTGARGEEVAAQYLSRCGYDIVERNFRIREGEVDIIAYKGDCLVFVEVRTRRGKGYGSPEESVTVHKQERLAALTEAYVQQMDMPPKSCRIDVVALELGGNGRVVRLEHIENITG